MRYSTHSEPGHNHHNEDNIRVQPLDGSTLLCALADGQGGQSGGAAASQVAVATCLQLAESYSNKQLLDEATWSKILSGADEAVEAHPDAGFTTLIGLCVTSDGICGASSGDSAVLLVSGKSAEVLTERQYKNPPVGTGGAYPIAFSAHFDGEAQLLIMSDGVWKFVGYDAIANLCQTKQGHELIFALRQLQLVQNGGTLPDDFSVIVV